MLSTLSSAVAKNRRAEHRWVAPLTRKIGTAYCCKCGLIRLQNRATQKAVNAQCKDKEDDFD